MSEFKQDTNNLTAFDILKAFGEYVNYDPDQTQFNLLSSNYTYHRAGDRITTICDMYDPTGRMAVLYARRVYDSVVTAERVKLYDLLLHPDAFERERRMYQMFHDDTVKQIENEYIEALNRATLAMTGRKIIGERDLESEKQIMYDSIEAVVEQLGSCREDIYVVSGRPVGKIENISTKIHLFNYMAECVLMLQNSAPDGAYFCYINNNGTADGYFAIMIKSNGNLFSVNDRVSEAYIGQHTNSRNNRWAEGHKGIFPYEQIMTFGDHDYLGYARSYNIDESKLNLKDMDAKHYIPVLLAIICVINGRIGKTPDKNKEVYLNTLIKGNLPGEKTTALITLDKTGLIAKTTQDLEIRFDREKFLCSEYRDEFTPRAGIKNQKLVDMYAQDFELKAKPLAMTAGNVLQTRRERLTGGADDSEKPIHAEFIGNIAAMRRQAYYEARIELADHIRSNIKKELQAFGKTETEQIKALVKWFDDAMRENVENLYPLLARAYRDRQASSDNPVSTGKDCTEDYPAWVKEIKIFENACPYIRYQPHFNEAKWKLNAWGAKMSPEYYYCPITGNRATIWFQFNAIDAEDIRNFIGDKELVRPLQNWHSSRYHRRGEDIFYGGNPILDAVDAVDFIELFDNDEVEFNYYIGFSKRGMARLLKENA